MIINMPLDSNVNPDNFPYVNHLFGQQSLKVWKCVNKSTFLKTNILRKQKIDELALGQLLYLASLIDHSDKSVFSKKHNLVLLTSDVEAVSAARWLNYGFFGAALGVLGSAYLALVPTSNSGSAGVNCSCITSAVETVSSSPTVPAILISTGVGLIALAVTYVAWNATGWKPDSSSNAYNNKQDLFRPLADNFNELSNRLLRLYFIQRGHEEACKLAKYIDLDKIEQQFLSRISNHETVESIIGRFKEAVLFVRSQGQIYPMRSDLITYIEQLEINIGVTIRLETDPYHPLPMNGYISKSSDINGDLRVGEVIDL